MNLNELQNFEKVFSAKIKFITKYKDSINTDPAHDYLHFKRVVEMTKKICVLENGNQFVCVPAAWLHDFIVIPKDSPLRSTASKMSAEAALLFLKEINYPEQFFDETFEAIAGHSFTANRTVNSLNAKIVQDADRLDGLGAIGIARCFGTSGLLKRSFYSELDPFCESRKPDDSNFSVDHFYKKLFLVADRLHTSSAQKIGHQRIQIMKIYLHDLKLELEI